MFEGTGMAGKGAQRARPEFAGRKALETADRSHQHKEETARELPLAARGADGV